MIMRSYDLRVFMAPFNKRGGSPDEVLKFALKLNIRGIAVTGFEDLERVNGNLSLLKKLEHEFGIELYSRADLSTSSGEELMRAVRKLRHKLDLVCVKLISKQLAYRAIKCQRVDSVVIPPLADLNLVFSLAPLAKENGVAFEINYAPLIRSNGQVRASIIGTYSVITHVVNKRKLPAILSSGAQRWYELRSFSGILAIGEVLGMDRHFIRDATVVCPKKLIERNRSRASEKLFSGVEVT